MIRSLTAAFLLGTAALSAGPALAVPVPKEQLLVAPANARHFTISSNAGKHGDIWAWTMSDGRNAYRMSMSLRGWITETDETILNGPGGNPTQIIVRGFTDSGDAGETYSVDSAGVAHWRTSVDEGSAPIAGKRYSTYGGPWLAFEQDIGAILAAGDNGIELLPSGRASISLADQVEVSGPDGPRKLRLAFTKGSGFAPAPFWLDTDKRFFGFAGGMGMLPAGYEGVREKLKTVQEAATAKLARDVSRGFLAPANATPTLIDQVKLFDAIAGRYRENRAVLVAKGKIVAVGAAGSIKAPAGATTIDGRGKTLVPGLWDSHLHVGGDDWNLIQNVATGTLNYRSPGSLIEDAQSIARRRAAGDLLAPDGKVSVIIDRKDPLAAQGSLTVSSLAETIAAVRKVKAAGMWGVKFYTSMKPEWIAPAAKEAHRLGLHVHGHVPAGMRPIDAVRAGYDEVTHINFLMMQAMPQAVVDKANTAARIEGPAKYGKDVDLSSPAMQAFYAELAKRRTIIDPTLVVWEGSLTADGSAIPPAYAPYAGVAPPLVARGWKIGGYPLFDGLTRDDFKRSYAKLVEITGRMHKAGVRIVAGTDGSGLELVRELELYRQAGLSNVEAMQSATIVPARMTGMDRRTGSITVGKEADLVLVDGDVEQDLGNLRHVDTVILDGYRLDGAALRTASGLSGMPK